tara:strand:- start:2068 stop:2697 length:630 start_codon:yes stop_codon:yes gene_type:complete
MKNSIILLSLILLVGCSSEPDNKTASFDKKSNSAVAKNTSPYHLGEVTVKWTAFKHAAKAQVGGKFDSVIVSGFKDTSDLKSAVSGVSFKLPVNSTKTGDKVRDYKIINSFFNTMVSTEFITGTIKSINPNGTGVVTINMNDIPVDKSFNWEMDDSANEFFLKTSIDVFSWGAQKALGALNDVCLEQHTGPDGINKLWPNVDIVVFAEL